MKFSLNCDAGHIATIAAETDKQLAHKTQQAIEARFKTYCFPKLPPISQIETAPFHGVKFPINFGATLFANCSPAVSVATICITEIL